MRLTPDRWHNLGWGGALAIAFALTLAFTFRVNALKSEVRLADREIARLTEEKMFLETEFETRANQEQLKELNEVDFGYEAPSARQYLKGERDLAALGKPADPGAPQPVRVAALGDAADAADRANAPIPAMVSPLTGHALSPAGPGGPVSAHRQRPRGLPGALANRLSRLDADVARGSLARE